MTAPAQYILFTQDYIKELGEEIARKIAEELTPEKIPKEILEEYLKIPSDKKLEYIRRIKPRNRDILKEQPLVLIVAMVIAYKRAIQLEMAEIELRWLLGKLIEDYASKVPDISYTYLYHILGDIIGKSPSTLRCYHYFYRYIPDQEKFLENPKYWWDKFMKEYWKGPKSRSKKYEYLLGDIKFKQVKSKREVWIGFTEASLKEMYEYLERGEKEIVYTVWEEILRKLKEKGFI